MKRLSIVLAPVTKRVSRTIGATRLVDNAQASGANGRKTDAIGY